jgi:hypothetical protein
LSVLFTVERRGSMAVLRGAADNFSFGKTQGKTSRVMPHGAPRMMPLLPENLSRK